ncbi:MAG: hypothetical protein RLZZ507_258 [Cyanobacteriota bacterium]|jgi:hypothetical protein
MYHKQIFIWVSLTNFYILTLVIFNTLITVAIFVRLSAYSKIAAIANVILL